MGFFVLVVLLLLGLAGSAAVTGQLMGRVSAFQAELDGSTASSGDFHPKDGTDGQASPFLTAGNQLAARQRRSRSLVLDIPRERMSRVLLHYHKQWIGPENVRLLCRGDPYPAFRQCERDPTVRASLYPKVETTEDEYHSPPINCPKLFNTEDPGPKGRDKTCSHAKDFFSSPPKMLQVYELRNVYVNSNGVAFNQTAYFDRDGCHRDLDESYHRGRTEVRYLKTAFNMLYGQGGNFYHGMIEWMPQWYMNAPFFRDHPDMPILSDHTLWNSYKDRYQGLFGVPLDAMNRISIHWKAEFLFFVERLYQPLYQDCGTAAPALWRSFRTEVLTPPEGTPAFNERWEKRVPEAQQAVGPTSAIPKDWVVVLARRPMQKRSIVESAEIERGMRKLFPGRLVVFRGQRPFPEVQRLFKRTLLFVGGHGAALSNMIFLPANASVVEIRPDQDYNACFHDLAHACSIKYYLTFSKGDRLSISRANVTTVMDVIRQAKENLPVYS